MPLPASPPPLVFSPPPPSASISISMVNAADRRLLTTVASNLADSQPSAKPQAVQVKPPVGQNLTFNAGTPLSAQQAILLPANMTTSILGIRISVAGSSVYALLAHWHVARRVMPSVCQFAFMMHLEMQSLHTLESTATRLECMISTSMKMLGIIPSMPCKAAYGCRVPMTSDNLKVLLLSMAATITANSIPVSWPAVTISALWFRAETGGRRRLLVRP